MLSIFACSHVFICPSNVWLACAYVLLKPCISTYISSVEEAQTMTHGVPASILSEFGFLPQSRLKVCCLSWAYKFCSLPLFWRRCTTILLVLELSILSSCHHHSLALQHDVFHSFSVLVSYGATDSRFGDLWCPRVLGVRLQVIYHKAATDTSLETTQPMRWYTRSEIATRQRPRPSVALTSHLHPRLLR